MAWFTANWFWVLTFIAFIAMHVFGHGGHRRRGEADRQPGVDETDKPEAQGRGLK